MRGRFFVSERKGKNNLDHLFKRTMIGLFVLLSVLTFMFSTQTVQAIKAIPDGGARFPSDNSGFPPEHTNVNAHVKKMWEEKKIPLGGKNPVFYTPTNGRRLIYDVYAGTHDNVKKRGFNVTPSSNYITLDGWSIIQGYHHHAEENQATYIGLVNKANSNDRLIYKAAMRANTSANSDIHDGQLNTCPANAFNRPVVVGQTGACNMNYNFTQFRAYIDMRDVFEGNNVGKEWEMYIIKRVEDQLVFDRLVLPFDTESFKWGNGTVTLRSGDDARNLTMVGHDVIKRDSIGGSAPSQGVKRHFAPGGTYRSNGVNDGTDNRVSVWYRVNDNVNATVAGRKYEATYSNRWTASAFWEFGGSIATLKYTVDKTDVRIRHVDANDGDSLITEETIKNRSIGSSYKANAKADGILSDSNGNPYRVTGNSTQTANVTNNKIFTFKYKAYAPVTINHVDELTGRVIDTEEVEREIGENYKVSGKKAGHFTNEDGYDYIPTGNQTFDGIIHDKTTVTFNYKVSFPNPNKVVEVGGGRNTHGKIDGKVYWELGRENDQSSSQLFAVNNFNPVGNHYAIRNVKHSITLDDYTETSENPIALSIEPERVTDQGMDYNFEYEYTNHIKYNYVCGDLSNDHCFEWKLDSVVPAWEAPYGQTFKLSDTEGTFTHTTVSRLGKIDHKDVVIYNQPTDQTGQKAGDSKVEYTYYLKEKAVKGHEVYYLLSDNPSRTTGLVGWVNELDLMTYSHYGMDNLAKEITLTGGGYSHERAWGGVKQRVHNLASYKGDKLHVNKTESVGDNIWYRGKMNGKGNNVWVHKNHTESDETIQIKSSNQTIVKSGTYPDTLKVETDHSHGQTFIESSIDELLDHELVVGRQTIYTKRDQEEKTFHESFVKTTNDMALENTLKTQSTLIMKPDAMVYDVAVPSGKHTKNNFVPFKKGWINGYYYPADLDESLQEDFKNHTEYDLGDFSVFLQQDKFIDQGIQNEKRTFGLEFVSDYFFISQKTGFMIGYPYAYRLNRHLTYGDEMPTNADILQSTQLKFDNQYLLTTGAEFTETILGLENINQLTNPDNLKSLQRYYIPVRPASPLQPNVQYENPIVLKNIGLSDLTWQYSQDFMFEHFLLGSGHHNEWFIEGQAPMNPNFTRENVGRIVIKHEHKQALVEVIKNSSHYKVNQFIHADFPLLDKIREIVEIYPVSP